MLKTKLVVSGSDSDDEIDRKAIADFLDSAGGIELLIIVSEGGARYGELEEKTIVSNSTIYERHGEAIDLGLIEDDARPDDGGIKKFYVLTSLGKAIRRKIHTIGADRLFWKIQELLNEYDEQKASIEEWVSDEKSNLDDLHEYMRLHEEADEPPRDRDYFWE